MRNKKFLTLLAAVLLAGSLGTGTILASAGTVESKPAGDGLITSKNEINLTNFKVLEQAEGDADAYVAAEATDYAVNYNNGEWQEMLVGTPVPKATMAKEGVKVTLTYKFVGLESDNLQFKLVPGAKSLSESHTYGFVLTGGNNGISSVAGERASATADDPMPQLFYNGGAGKDIPLGGELGWEAYSWSAGTFKNNITAYGNTYFRMEMTVNENDWVDVKLINGFFSEWDRWTEVTSVVSNWAPYDGTSDFFANAYVRYANGLVVDGATLTASYQEGETTKTDTIFTTDMDDASKVITEKDAAAAADCFIARGLERTPREASGLNITNPAAGTGIVTRAALQTDKGLATNLEMKAQVILKELAAGQKVGFGFGYENSRSLTGAHSYFYFTVKDGKVMFGGEKVDKEEASSALFAEVEVADGAIGERAAAIPVTFTGKGADLEIVVGENEKILLENFDPDGFFAVTHKGEGNLSYMLKDNLTMTGYQFKDNEEGAETVTSNFTGNYISSDKFQFASNIAPETHMIKTDSTSHDLTGVTAENGKLGFYGTSTGTRLLTTKKYADFVMQFDYISVPVQQRGALVLSGNRPSAAYLVFGMKEGGLSITDSTVYAIGINEGLAAIDFYGNNETIIAPLAMAATCKCPTVALSKLKATTSPTATSIPNYNGGYDASKPDNNVAAWYDPDPDNAGNIYSMYNKTTRVKLVCVNNKVALFLAEVDAATGAVKGEYIKVLEFNAADTEGYLGIATDSPAYFEMDNFAVTPVSRRDVLTFAASEKALTADFVADVAPADMANDPLPTPLEKPELTANPSAKKVTWKAVDGAASYDVTVKLGSDTVLEKNVTATEIDLSSLTADGTYKVTVTANPSDTAAHIASRNSVDYVLSSGGDSASDRGDSSTKESSENTSGSSGTESGCGSAMGGGALIAAAGAAALLFSKKRRK